MANTPSSGGRLVPTAYHTIGPFFPPAFIGALDHDLTRTAADARQAAGAKIRLTGSVFQEDGAVLPNTIIELWQADANGCFAHPADPRHAQADPDFAGWGRARSDRDGGYEFLTVVPGTYEVDGRERAPHLNLFVFASGIMARLVTVVFFEGDARNGADPVLASVPAGRRAGLLARRAGDIHGMQVHRFDIVLGGTGETPFFTD